MGELLNNNDEIYSDHEEEEEEEEEDKEEEDGDVYDDGDGDTVETLYNTVNFCWSTHKRHSIARPKGRGMGCLLWVQRATYCVGLSKLSSIRYLL